MFPLPPFETSPHPMHLPSLLDEPGTHWPRPPQGRLLLASGHSTSQLSPIQPWAHVHMVLEESAGSTEQVPWPLHTVPFVLGQATHVLPWDTCAYPEEHSLQSGAR